MKHVQLKLPFSGVSAVVDVQIESRRKDEHRSQLISTYENSGCEMHRRFVEMA